MLLLTQTFGLLNLIDKYKQWNELSGMNASLFKLWLSAIHALAM